MKHESHITNFFFLCTAFLFFGFSYGIAKSSTKGNCLWAIKMADSFIARHPDTLFDEREVGKKLKWNYVQAVVYEPLYLLWKITGDKKYLNYVQHNLDDYLDSDGTIKTYKLSDYNLDCIAPGRQLLYLQKATGSQKYKNAVDTLREQLREQPRTHEGGFWHKGIYPYQMWLDGLYMAEPFEAIYATYYNEPKDFDDIAQQFIWMEQHARDSGTGLLYHGWDESKAQRWANPETGCSPSFWGRSMGWYMMGLVDVLDYFPLHHPKRDTLITILRRTAKAVLAYRDPRTHLWWQVMDQPGKQGNYLESSASAMFTYVFARGADKGYLDKKYVEAAQQSFAAMVKNFVTVDKQGYVSFTHTSGTVGLGGTPYRDGSYTYYTSVPQETNDLRGVGPFLLAAIELEKIQLKEVVTNGR
jgi:unsaturated rhamnogalacturonyl hydrolase